MNAEKSKNILIILFLVTGSLFLFSLSFSLLGCSTTDTAKIQRSETSAWVDGKVIQELDVSFSKVVQAAILALQALELNITKTDIAKDVAQIIGEYVDARTIWIDLRSISERSTHLEIRVSVKGNKEASLRILEKIQSFL